jgi:hypothetical protein
MKSRRGSKRYMSALNRKLCGHCQGRIGHSTFSGLHNVPVRVNQDIQHWLHKGDTSKVKDNPLCTFCSLTTFCPYYTMQSTCVMMQCIQGEGEGLGSSEGLAQLPDMSVVLGQLDEITQQRKRLLEYVKSDGSSRDDLRILKEDIGR